MLTIGSVLGYNHDTQTMWYWVQIGQLVILHKHIGAFAREEIQYRLFNGPGEFITVAIIVLLAKLGLGSEAFDTLLHQTTGGVIDYAKDFIATQNWKVEHFIYSDHAKQFAAMIYVMVLTLVLTRIIGMYLLQRSAKKKEETTKASNGNTVAHGQTPYHFATVGSLIICIAYRAIPMMIFNHSGSIVWLTKPSMIEVISDGIAISIITGDVVVSRMASRELHPIVILLTMFGIVNNFAILAFAAFYYISILFEVSSYTKLPILQINRNVYSDGIYDMCHSEFFLKYIYLLHLLNIITMNMIV